MRLEFDKPKNSIRIDSQNVLLTWNPFAHVSLEFGRFLVVEIWWILHQRLPFYAAFRQCFIVIGHDIIVGRVVKIAITFETVFVNITGFLLLLVMKMRLQCKKEIKKRTKKL